MLIRSTSPAFSRSKFSRFKYLGTAGLRVHAFEVDAPEVVVGHRNTGEYLFDGMLDKPRHAALVGALDLVPLLARYPEQREQIRRGDHPTKEGPPEFLVHTRLVDVALLLEARRVEEPVDVRPHPPHVVDIEIQPPRHQAGRAVEVERRSSARLAEEFDVSIPEAPGRGSQMAS